MDMKEDGHPGVCQKTKDGMQKCELEMIAMLDGVPSEDHHGPGSHQTSPQTAGKTCTCDAAPGEAEGHRAVREHTRLQGMPSRKSRNQPAST